MPLCNQTLKSSIPEEENRYGLVGNRLMVFCSRNASAEPAGRAEVTAINQNETGDEGPSPRPLWPDWLKSTFRSHP